MKVFYQQNIETIENFLWRLLQIIWKYGVSFCIFILCAKMLSPEDFWIYNYLLSIIFFITIFSDFGISQSASKFVSQHKVKEQQKLPFIFFNSFLLVTFLSVIGIMVSLWISYFFFSQYFKYLLYLLPLIFFIPLTSIYDGIYRWMEKFRFLSLVTTISWLISLIFVYFFIFYFWLIWALISQTFFYLLLWFAFILSYKEVKILKVDKEIIKKVFDYSIFIGVANLGYFFYTKVDILFLWYYWYIIEIWYYEIINKIFEMLLIPVMILATVISPKITQKFTLWEIWDIRKKFIKEVIFLFIIGIWIAAFSSFFFPYLFQIFLHEYNQQTLLQILMILLWILPLRFFSSYMNVWYITSIGYAKILMYTTLIWWIINFVFNIIFLQYFWFIWVIYSTILSQIIFILFNGIIFYRIITK